MEAGNSYRNKVSPEFNSASSKFTEKDVNVVSTEDSSTQLIDNLKNNEVKRALKPRHISMIAIGGTIGTGIFIGSGSSIMDAGPASTLINYFFIASIALAVTQGLGEMATYIPISGSFSQFTARWCSPALGAANGYNYWFSWCITFALELSVVGRIIEYWTEAVPIGAWIGIFFVILITINLFPVEFFGEIEFWIASLKVIAVFGFLIYALCMVCGATQDEAVGFKYWRNPGAFGPGLFVDNPDTARFLGWLSSLTSTAFTFQGCELIGIASGEMRSPKSLPKAIKSIYVRIILFYILSIFFIGMLVPYNDRKLTSTENYVSASPFIIAMKNSGTKILPDIFNGVILVTIISAGNSNIYCGSRVLYGLGEVGVGPKFLTLTTKHGVPYVTVLCTAIFGLLAFLVLDNEGSIVFDWLLNITAVSGLISWGWIAASHVRFMNILESRGISRDSLPYKAPLNPYYSRYAAIVVLILVFIQGFTCFFGITAASFFTAYISVIFFAACWLFFQFFFNGFKGAFKWENLLVPLDQCDIDTGVREMEEYADEPEPKNLWEKTWAIVA